MRAAQVSTPEKAEVARANGATDVVLADGWLAAVKELTGGRGVDIVLEPGGLTAGGRLLVVGFTAGEVPTVKVNRLLLENV